MVLSIAKIHLLRPLPAGPGAHVGQLAPQEVPLPAAGESEEHQCDIQEEGSGLLFIKVTKNL